MEILPERTHGIHRFKSHSIFTDTQRAAHGAHVVNESLRSRNKNGARIALGKERFDLLDRRDSFVDLDAALRLVLGEHCYNGLGNLDRYNGSTTPNLSYEKNIHA